MKYFLSCLISTTLIFQIAFTPSAFATARATSLIETIGFEYGTKRSKTGELTARSIKINQSIKVRPQEFLAHQGQALILIMILTGVDLVKQHMSEAMLTRKSIDSKLLLQHAGEAADHILNSGEIWSSLAGASATSAIASKPMTIINKLIENTGSRTILKNLLQSGIATFITFVGWEVGGQLYSDAVEMISDADDYERAKRLMPLLVNSIQHQLSPSTLRYEQDWLILKQVFGNMMTILIYDHDLRNMWLYNTWRNRIATGEFVTLVSAMVGAGVIGTALFPGAGTLAGMMFGVVGGVLTLFIPQEAKDGITSFIQSMRYGFWKMGDDRGPLFSVKKDVIRLMYKFVSKGEPLPPLLEFIPDSTAGEKMANIIFEKMFRYDSRIQLSISLRSAAETAGNRSKVSEIDSQINNLSEGYKTELSKLSNLYLMELQDLNEVLIKYPILADARSLSKYPQLRNVVNYRGRLLAISNFLTYFAQTVEASLQSGDQSYLPALNRFFIFGFSEDLLLELIDS